MTFTIEDPGDGATAVGLPTVTLPRPCYLVDLTQATPASSGRLSLDGGGRRVTWNGEGERMTYDAVHERGTMRDWPALTDLTIGTIQEIVANGLGGHPLHIHIIPFQITAMNAGCCNNGYFQEGDWHDTLMLPDSQGDITVRLNLDKFTGKAVIHCHILEHEDQGMMAYMNFVGTEGAVFEGSKSIDATCYDTAYNSGETNTQAPGGDAITQAPAVDATTKAMAVL